MRLIDADALLDKQEALYMKRHILFHGVTAYTIESSPTIDPETLPIVQELREQLAKVTAERDAAIANLKQAKSGCDFCRYTHGFSCDLEEPCIMYECWEWRGIE